jgi:hypothetical protein
VRLTGCIVFLGLISACHGAPITEVDGGSPGSGGGSGTAGAGGAGAGTAGVGGRGTGGRGGSGGAAGTGANACLRCDTQCQDGLCDLAVVRTSQSVVNSSATSVALNDGRLYFVVGTLAPTGIQVLSVGVEGVGETELYPRHDCSNCQLSVAVDATDVFFAGLNGTTPAILAVPKVGGNGTARVVCVTPDAVPIALTLEGDNVYYMRADAGIERCPKAGGATMRAVNVGSAQSPNVVIRMSSRPGFLLWGDRDTGVVTRLDTNALTKQVLGVTMNPEQSGPYGVCDVVDDGTAAHWILCAWPYIVYFEGGPNMPMERARGLGGGDPNAIFDQYGSVAMDGGYVYFTEAGYLNRVPKTGGTVEARARMFDASAYAIKALIVGFDDRYVYLARANQGDGAIYRVIK